MISSQDGRDQTTLDNCVAAGLGPNQLWRGHLQETFSTEVFQIGTAGAGGNPLDPETSESYSYGFVFEQPFTEAFEAKLGVSYLLY